MNQQYDVLTGGGVTTAAGFTAAAVAADVKGNHTGKLDIAVLAAAAGPVAAAGVFTTNKVKAAPVLLSQQRLTAGTLRAVVVNSGNANACTGEKGMTDAQEMTAITAEVLGCAPEQVAVASTGVIGVPMPMVRVASGVRLAAGSVSANGGAAAAQAIMTTDTVAKEVAIAATVGGRRVVIGGMAKGSGMIHPNMATMLGFVTTDAPVEPQALQVALAAANAASFNMITVDGDTSTNDSLYVLASGAAGGNVIQLGTPAFNEFQAALQYVLTVLAKKIAADGEGATKLLEMQVGGALTEVDARKAARQVCASALVKTALFGNDANWGRILCALGYSGADFDASKVDLWLGDLPMMQAGAPVPFDEEAAIEVLKQPQVVVKADLHAGDASAVAWGCDFSYDYVKINGSYRT